VSLSSDGNTLAVGDFVDNGNIGATWIFTRNGTVWTQQGDKLVGSGSSGLSNQRTSQSLSSDGNTLAIGGYYTTNDKIFASTCVLTRSEKTWTQACNELIWTGTDGNPVQGTSVYLAGPGENNNLNATLFFTRNNGFLLAMKQRQYSCLLTNIH
jgi:hypothetical protein